jgi:hypothetical protein
MIVPDVTTHERWNGDSASMTVRGIPLIPSAFSVAQVNPGELSIPHIKRLVLAYGRIVMERYRKKIVTAADPAEALGLVKESGRLFVPTRTRLIIGTLFRSPFWGQRFIEYAAPELPINTALNLAQHLRELPRQADVALHPRFFEPYRLRTHETDALEFVHRSISSGAITYDPEHMGTILRSDAVGVDMGRLARKETIGGSHALAKRLFDVSYSISAPAFHQILGRGTPSRDGDMRMFAFITKLSQLIGNIHRFWSILPRSYRYLIAPVSRAWVTEQGLRGRRPDYYDGSIVMIATQETHKHVSLASDRRYLHRSTIVGERANAPSRPPPGGTEDQLHRW